MRDRITAMLVVAALGVLPGCSDSTGPGGTGTVSLSTAGPASGTSAALAPAFSVRQTDGSSTLVIESVDLVLREIELERANAECDDVADEDACEEFEAAIRLFPVPVDGMVRKQIAIQAPADTYDEIEFDIHKPEDDPVEQTQADIDFLADNPSFADISIRVTGTWNDGSFTYESDLNVEQEHELPTPLVVEENGSVNVTLKVDVSTWFVDAGGNLVNPATANKGGANENLVKDNIKNSFEAFEDDDEDGVED